MKLFFFVFTNVGNFT